MNGTQGLKYETPDDVHQAFYEQNCQPISGLVNKPPYRG